VSQKRVQGDYWTLTDDSEEIDSYMYQTVGQDAIEVVAQAIGLPLIRRVITGSAVEQGSEYGDRTRLDPIKGDETEDLYELLSQVKVFNFLTSSRS
jgi:diphthine-ammonia ligase